LNRQHVELGLRSETIRRANLSSIVRALHVEGPLSRSELGLRTGLTRSAIRVLIGELSGAGLVDERSGASLGTPGRPSVLVRLRPERAAVLAIEINVDSIAAAVVGIGGDVLRSRRVDRARSRWGVDNTIEDVADLVRSLDAMDPSAAGRESLIGIAVAFAGIVRRSEGIVALAPNLGWREVPLGKLVARALGTSHEVLVANDADLSALAEHRRGIGAGVENLLFISGEVGVGGGLILDGRPFSGISGYGGEVGHIPLNPAGVSCGCGSVGCWETEIGERALLARAGQDVDRGRAGIEQVIEAAENGDRRALDALQHVGTWLGRGIAALVNVLNPQIVVMGGLFERIYPFAAHPLSRELERLALRPAAAVLSVVPTSLGVDAPLLGAAELAFERLLDDPASLSNLVVQSEWRVVA
jgi:predicted NBD/HSP70 family sugar kinase